MEQYLQYKAAEFAEDTEFIKWVQSDFTSYADKWDTFMNDNPSLGDEISEAIDIIELFQFEKSEVSSDQQDNLLTRIHSTVDAQPKTITESPVPAVAKPTTPEVVKPQSQQPAAAMKEVAAPATVEASSMTRFLVPIAAIVCLMALAFYLFS